METKITTVSLAAKEDKYYKGINLFPPNTRRGDFIEVSIPKGTKVFAITDGTNFNGGNFRFLMRTKQKICGSE